MNQNDTAPRQTPGRDCFVFADLFSAALAGVPPTRTAVLLRSIVFAMTESGRVDWNGPWGRFVSRCETDWIRGATPSEAAVRWAGLPGGGRETHLGNALRTALALTDARTWAAIDAHVATAVGERRPASAVRR